MTEETKTPRSYHVRTVSGYTYTITADYLEYVHDENTMYFKKELKGQTNIDGSEIWVVAFFKISDIEFVGIDGYFNSR